MKTAISIPDEVFQTAEQLADRLGRSRSQLYTEAVTNYIEKHQHTDVTKQLNAIYTTESSRLDPSLAKMQVATLPQERW